MMNSSIWPRSCVIATHLFLILVAVTGGAVGMVFLNSFWLIFHAFFVHQEVLRYRFPDRTWNRRQHRPIYY